MGTMLLCTGGCRSGKSAYAQKWVEERAANRLYIATAYACDEEMATRIARHRNDRGEGWTTLETDGELWREPELLFRAVEDRFDVHAQTVHGCEGALLFDCLTLWTSRCFEKNLSESAILALAERLFAALVKGGRPVAVVTNEVGMGLVPPSPQNRAWRDTLGRVNQIAAAKADAVVLMVSGLPLFVKGG